jgi:hypothetical protein
VFLGALIGIRADDFGDVTIDIAISPFRKPIIGPHVGQLPRRITSGISFVSPILPIEIEILCREQIDRQRLDSRRWLNVLRLELGLLRIRCVRDKYRCQK